MSLLNTTIAAEIKSGCYNARILEYKEVDDKRHKPYIAIRLDVDHNIVEDRWYESRLNYLMACLRKQFNLEYQTCTLQDILDEATKTDFFVQIDYDDRYGRQISYGMPTDSVEPTAK